MAAFSRYFPHVSSTIHMEAETCKVGLLIAIHQRWDNVDLERDCATVVSTLSSANADYSQLGWLIEDCRAYKDAIGSCEF